MAGFPKNMKNMANKSIKAIRAQCVNDVAKKYKREIERLNQKLHESESLLSKYRNEITKLQRSLEAERKTPSQDCTLSQEEAIKLAQDIIWRTCSGVPEEERLTLMCHLDQAVRNKDVKRLSSWIDKIIDTCNELKQALK